MKNNSINLVIRQLLGLIGVLGIAYGCEVLIEALKARNAVTTNLNNIILWTYAITTLLVAGITLLLFWYTITQSSRSILMAIIYLVVGLIIVLSPLIYFLPITSWLLRPYPEPLYPRSIFYIGGGGIAMIGLLRIVLPRSGLNRLT